MIGKNSYTRERMKCIDHCGQDALNLAIEVFERQASHCGFAARKQEKHDAESAAGIYAALNDARLNGMPCDQSDMLLENTMEKTVWESGPRLQESSWKKAGVDPAVMNPLYQRWMGAFVSGMNPGFICRQTMEISNGDAVNRWRIART